MVIAAPDIGLVIRGTGALRWQLNISSHDRKRMDGWWIPNDVRTSLLACAPRKHARTPSVRFCGLQSSSRILGATGFGNLNMVGDSSKCFISSDNGIQEPVLSRSQHPLCDLLPNTDTHSAQGRGRSCSVEGNIPGDSASSSPHCTTCALAEFHYHIRLWRRGPTDSSSSLNSTQTPDTRQWSSASLVDRLQRRSDTKNRIVSPAAPGMALMALGDPGSPLELELSSRQLRY
ncbi:hypothetical protein FB451DRAFT_1187897 [Mycena latifolia]|nr:hypothetical protein FB451DRAFT_1187897 [Mycena latifolia]